MYGMWLMQLNYNDITNICVCSCYYSAAVTGVHVVNTRWPLLTLSPCLLTRAVSLTVDCCYPRLQLPFVVAALLTAHFIIPQGVKGSVHKNLWKPEFAGGACIAFETAGRGGEYAECC